MNTLHFVCLWICFTICMYCWLFFFVCAMLVNQFFLRSALLTNNLCVVLYVCVFVCVVCMCVREEAVSTSSYASFCCCFDLCVSSISPQSLISFISSMLPLQVFQSYVCGCWCVSVCWHVFVCVSCEFCIFCLFPFFLLSKFCINYLFNKMMMITITIKHL